MIANYYTLRHISADLDRQLAGGQLVHAFSQNKGELVLGFQTATSGAEEEIAVILGCDPSMNFVHARDAYARARRNSIDLFSPIIGERLAHVSMAPVDREIQFHLSSGRNLLFRAFGSTANVLLCDDERVVLDSFLKTVTHGSHAAQADRTSEPSDLKGFHSSLHSGTARPDESARAAFKRTFARFGNVLVRELFHRAGISPETPVASLADRDIESLFTVHRLLSNELVSPPVPSIYYDGAAPAEFAIIALEHLQQFRVETFETIHSAIRAFLGSTRTQRTYHIERSALTSVLRRDLDQAERTIAKLSAESVHAPDAERFEWMGKLLTAHLFELTKGMSEAILEDTRAGTAELVQIPLDPHLTPAKNAERLFERAKRIRRTVGEQRIRTKDLQARHRELTALITETEEIDSVEELRRFIDHHRTDLERLGIRVSRAGKPAPAATHPFRVFVVAGGFQVWAGKSGENNDLLSARHTAKNDLWFHARGVGGSHVVLKVGTGKGEVSKTAIQQAAGIAAYYSKMKNASFVPVTMCEGKYVRKPKGAPAGTVTVERETTIFAEPSLPAPVERAPA